MSQGKMADDRRIKAAVDLISNLPDEILQHIHCFIPIKVAITTSLLSRRWKHVWCEIPSLSLDATILTAASVNKTLSHYTAPKTKSFHLKTYRREYTPHINRWIKFALSHNVENLSLDFWVNSYPYKLPDFFYNSSSFKQLNINELRVLDLRKSLRLRTLQIRRNMSRSLLLVETLFRFYLLLRFVMFLSRSKLKVKTLTLDTDICQYVIPGIERLLQNSPDLETLTALSRDFNSMPGKYLDQYLKSQGFNLNTCWRSTSLNNRDKMLLLLDEGFLQFEIEDVVVPTFAHNKNVNVVLCATKLMASEEW
ncbi:BnaC05g35080D [Brassica napus]|uniref:BnaC05g35080D protein n=1 Tax=Brassica napus TaxID=3708 RepID=A0A078GGE4_BRANA|nr:BnaC05g35080D [Brassica napus]